MMGQQITIDEYLASRPRFAGAECKPEFDQERLTGQMRRIFGVVKDGKWAAWDANAAAKR